MSLAVGETHGWELPAKTDIDPEGVEPLLDLIRARPDSTPSGLVYRRGASFRGFHPRLMILFPCGEQGAAGALGEARSAITRNLPRFAGLLRR